jgi:hypothetical protein
VHDLDEFLRLRETGGNAKLVAQPKTSGALSAFLDFVEEKTDVQIILVYEAGLSPPPNVQSNMWKKEVTPGPPGLQGHNVVFRQVWVRYIGAEVAKRPELKQFDTYFEACLSKNSGLEVCLRAMLQRSVQMQLAVFDQKSRASRSPMELMCGLPPHFARLMGMDRDSF